MAGVNDEVKTIHAVGIPVISSMIDIANARLEFERGCVVNVTDSRISDKSMRKIRIFQPDAYISIDFAAQGVSLYRKLEEEGRLPFIVSEKLTIEPGDSLAEEIKSFLTAVKHGSPPPVPGEAGMRALKGTASRPVVMALKPWLLFTEYRSRPASIAGRLVPRWTLLPRNSRMSIPFSSSLPSAAFFVIL